MVKTFVINSSEDTRVPFLRGILTRSLVDAGVDFSDAYRMASTIRQDLSGMEEVTSNLLKDMVLGLLKGSYNEQIIENYQTSGRIPAPIMVYDKEGSSTPFSQSEQLLCLQSCGLSTKEAEMAGAHIYQYLIENEICELSSSRLAHLTYICLHRKFSSQVAKRYLVWIDYIHSGRSLILLVGGTTGCGKSTISTEVAHRLGIVRTQSTDMLREVMRMMIPERLLPVLHTSAFNAWKSLPMAPPDQVDNDTLIADGYRSQMELLSVPCEAVIQRALRERVSLILEGVHVHPSLMGRIENTENAVIVAVMLAVLKQNKLKKRLRGRGDEIPQRPGKRYLSNFEQIWSLQSFLLSEADRYGVPIIANNEKEKTAVQIMSTIIDSLADGFSATPSKVFGREN